MRKKCMQLLYDLIDTKLNISVYECDERQFDEAMEALDRFIELSKIDNEKIETKNNKLMKYIEIGGTILVAPLIGYLTNKSLMKMMSLFEKNYTFTTTAGRSLSKIFSFKK